MFLANNMFSSMLVLSDWVNDSHSCNYSHKAICFTYGLPVGWTCYTGMQVSWNRDNFPPGHAANLQPFQSSKQKHHHSSVFLYFGFDKQNLTVSAEKQECCPYLHIPRPIIYIISRNRIFCLSLCLLCIYIKHYIYVTDVVFLFSSDCCRYWQVKTGTCETQCTNLWSCRSNRVYSWRLFKGKFIS